MYNPSEKCVFILEDHASGRTIKQYFNTEIIGKEVIDSIHTLKLVGVFLGRSKEQLDAVDTSVPLDMTVLSFGGFLQYQVSSCRKSQEPQQSRVNAFQVMMSSIRQQSVTLPRKEPPNQKDKLFNSVVDLLEDIAFPCRSRVIWTEPGPNVN